MKRFKFFVSFREDDTDVFDEEKVAYFNRFSVVVDKFVERIAKD